MMHVHNGDKWFHLSSPGGVASDDATTSDRSTPDVRQVLAVKVLIAGCWDRVFDQHGRRSRLQDCKQSVGLRLRSVKLRLWHAVGVQSFDGIVHQTLPRPLVDSITTGTPWLGATVRLYDVTHCLLTDALRRCVPQSCTKRTVAVLVFVNFLHAWPANRITTSVAYSMCRSVQK